MLIRYLSSFIIGVLFSISIAPPSHAVLIYHKPAFQGKVIDAETKEPIEGAVVVAVYHVRVCAPLYLGPECGSNTADVQEVLTDKNGEFNIPAHTFFYPWPFTLGGEDTSFIIFKPGYGSFPDWRVSPSKGTDVHFEEFFSKDYGVEKEVLWREPWKVGAESKKVKVTFGIVELPKLKTREERIEARRGVIPGPGIPSKKMQNLIRLYNEENVSLGFEPISLP